MEYSDFPYPFDTPLFPTNVAVKDYLHAYAKELENRGIIRYNSEITKVIRCTKNYNKKWKVIIRNTTGSIETTYWDTVIVATGTFANPVIPKKIRTERAWENHYQAL